MTIELTECRALLEEGAATLAAQRASDATLDQLDTLAEHMSSLPRRAYRERGRAEIELHRRLVEATGNAPLARMVLPVLAGTGLAGELLGRRIESVAEHRRIVDALAGREPLAAGDAVREHFAALAASLRGNLPRDPRLPALRLGPYGDEA